MNRKQPETVLTSAQMRKIEQDAIAHGTVTGLELMERAGQGVLEAVFAQWPELGPELGPELDDAEAGNASDLHAVILCGPGNNGGDGFVVARLLTQAGWDVQVFAHGWDMLWDETAQRADPPPDALANALRWRDTGGRSAPLDTAYDALLCQSGAVLVVDALLGIGQTRDPSALLRDWWAQWDRMCARGPEGEIYCVSIDIPTGYDSDSGICLTGIPFEPDLVVTFHARKPVHRMLEADDIPVAVADIGL